MAATRVNTPNRSANPIKTSPQTFRRSTIFKIAGVELAAYAANSMCDPFVAKSV